MGRLAESRTAAVQDINTNINRENITLLIELGKRMSSVSTRNRKVYVAGDRQLITSRSILDSQNSDLPKSPRFRHLFLVSYNMTCSLRKREGNRNNFKIYCHASDIVKIEGWNSSPLINSSIHPSFYLNICNLRSWEVSSITFN